MNNAMNNSPYTRSQYLCLRNLMTLLSVPLLLIACGTSEDTLSNNANSNSNGSEKNLLLPIPKDILSFDASIDGTLRAYASIDDNPLIEMNIGKNSTELTLTNLTVGQHTLHLRFNFTSPKHINKESPDGSYGIAYANIPLVLNKGINRLSLNPTDIKYDIDTDGDSISNIHEFLGGSNPGESPNTPTIISNNKIYVSQVTDQPVLNILAVDPNADPITLSISDDPSSIFTLSTGVNPTLSISANLTTEIIPDQYNLSITSTDGPNEATQKLSYSVVHYFSASDEKNGFELWRSDGTDLGTEMVKNINPDGDSSPQHITLINNDIYFSAYTEKYGRELWRSDGTFKDTRRIGDINKNGDSTPSNLLAVAKRLYFTAFDGQDISLWRTDGDEMNTKIITTLSGQTLLNPASLTHLNGLVYFSASIKGGSDKRGLWRSDGTATGTIPVKTPVDAVFYNPENLVTSKGNLLFVAHRTGKPANELWMMDGSSEQTTLLKNFAGFGISSAQLVDFDGVVYFSANAGKTGMELWEYSGIDPMPAMFQNINVSATPASAPYTHSFPFNLTVVKDTTNGNRLYFSAKGNSKSTGSSLWQLRKNELAATRIEISNTTTRASNPQHLTSANGSLYLSAWVNTIGRTLGMVGTSSYTKITSSNILDATPSLLRKVNNALYYTAYSGNGRDLWRFNTLNPGQSETTLVTNLNSSNRVTLQGIRGVVAQYDFNDGIGNTINDVSAVGAPSALNIITTDSTRWISGALVLDRATKIHSAGSIEKVIRPIKFTEELSIELWLSSASTESLVATIMSIGHSDTESNLRLQQHLLTGNSINYQAHVRSSETYANAERISSAPKADTKVFPNQLLQLVYTQRKNGDPVYYLNGKAVTTFGPATGSFSTWSNDMPLTIAAGLDFKNPWLGTLYRLAIYNCALSVNQINQNYINGSEEPITSKISCR